MKLKITLYDMPAFRQRFLDADFLFSNEEIRFQLCDAVDRIRKSEGKYRILDALRKLSSNINLSLEAMVDSFEAASNIDFMQYRIIHKEGNYSVVEIEIRDEFFSLFEMVKKAIHIPIGYGRNGFVKKLEKEIRNKFTKRYEIEHG